jgi:hypothetical protein
MAGELAGYALIGCPYLPAAQTDADALHDPTVTQGVVQDAGISTAGAEHYSPALCPRRHLRSFLTAAMAHLTYSTP